MKRSFLLPALIILSLISTRIMFAQNVGINIPTPIYRFHVVEDVNTTGSRAIYGLNSATSTTQQLWGVYGEARGTAATNPGAGVMGHAANTTGNAAGVRGEAASSTGKGVWGWATSSTGINYAIYGTTGSSSGYAGYFEGGKNYFQGNVGIGNSAPEQKLHVEGNGLFQTGMPFIHINGTSSSSHAGITFKALGTSKAWLFWDEINDILKMNADNTGARNDFTILPTGNVGIGTATPAYKLHVMGSGSRGSLLVSPSTSLNDSSELILAEGSSSDYTYSMSLLYDGLQDQLEVHGRANTTLYGPHMVIGRNSGNVGIGADPGSDRFVVASVGDIRTAYFSGEGIGITDATVYSTNSAGIAGFYESNAADAAMVLQQLNTSGSFLKAFGPNGGEHELVIEDDGTIDIYNGAHIRTISIDPYEGATTDGSQITMYNNAGTATILLDADYVGDGRVTTMELEITGGSDITENFFINSVNDLFAEPGMLVSIDPEDPGKLIISDKAYDHRLAGIISGAGGIESGFIMSQKGSLADGDTPVAIAGRVYCLADASYGKIMPGDLLTSSPVPGHAMKVGSMKKAGGAIIGKAMTSLEQGRGQVLVLVTIQ